MEVGTREVVGGSELVAQARVQVAHMAVRGGLLGELLRGRRPVEEAEVGVAVELGVAHGRTPPDQGRRRVGLALG